MAPLEGTLGGLVSLADALRPGAGPSGVSGRAVWTTVGMEGFLQESSIQNSSVTLPALHCFPLLGPCSGRGSVWPGAAGAVPPRGGREALSR